MSAEATAVHKIAEAFATAPMVLVKGAIEQGGELSTREVTGRSGLSSALVNAALAKLERDGEIVSRFDNGGFLWRLA
jgi:DNA-binding GntR family transcriptional regulator